MTASIVEQASDALRALIARGEFQPGDRLPPERVLAEGFGVSRPTMREAIRRLTDAGLLEARRGSGTYVANIDLEEVFAVRLQLEPFAARLAARSRTAGDLDRLRALVKRLVAELDSAQAFADIDLEIHTLIGQAAGNSVLLSVQSQLVEVAKLSRAVTSPERTARTATLRRMRSLVRAIANRNEEAAADAMASHLIDVRDLATSRARDRSESRALTVVAPGHRPSAAQQM